MATICIFGASSEYGAWDIKQGGWVSRLRKFVDKEFIEKEKIHLTGIPLLIYNLGVSGDTTEDLLERFEVECWARAKEAIKYKEKFSLIFSIGKNDSQFIHDKKSFKISPEKFRKNIQKLIRLAKKFTASVIFLGISPCDESETNPYEPNISFKNEYIQSYNNILRSICKRNKVSFIEIFGRWMNMNYKSFLGEDGLHLNSKGHQEIFEMVKDFIIKNKII